MEVKIAKRAESADRDRAGEEMDPIAAVEALTMLGNPASFPDNEASLVDRGSEAPLYNEDPS